MNHIWIEKYRPKTFEDIIGQDKNINILKNLINNNSLPHLMFHGKSGVGKTSTINAIINKLYGKSKTFMVMKLDASDDRGINTVRDEIKGFAEKLTIFNRGVKLIVLDEADSMTFDAQFALRRIMEKYSDNTRICLICNYENKIIQPIKSRCLDIRFFPISNNIIHDRLKLICNNENIQYNNEGLDTIVNISDGDMRKAINILQNISNINKKLSPKICFSNLGIINNKVLNNIMKYLLDSNINFNKTLNFIKTNIIKEGIFISLFLKEITKYLINNKDIIIENKGNEIYTKYFIELADIENKVSLSTFEDIYIIGIVCIFKKN
jgi:replication factor C subunit 3/5